jgi:hypothetical protein
MPKGLLVVQSRPASPDAADDLNRWYDETHIPEILGLAGFAAARRLRAADGESFLAVYDLDDVDVARAALGEAQKSGAMTAPSGVQLNPPPTVQWFHDLADPGRSGV